MILAIDPGNVTGIAWYDPSEPQCPPQCWEVEGGLYGMVDRFPANNSLRWDCEQIVMEDFIIRPDTHTKTREPAVYETLGYMKGWAWSREIPCMMIGPSEHTPFSEYKKKSKSKIVRLGWSQPSKDMHADSAMSVLLLGLTRLYPTIARDLLKEIIDD